MKTPPILITLGLIASPPVFAHHSAPPDVQVSARGTGRTTGHIATLTVQNKSRESVVVSDQMVYIPSSGKYQSYIGRIPDGTPVAPGGTVQIPVEGYCTDVHKPPVPSGENMPPVDQWIPVTAPTIPEPMNPPGGSVPPGSGTPVSLVPGEPVSPVPPVTIEIDPDLSPDSWATDTRLIPGPVPPGSSVVPTWPGTDIPVGGTFDPDKNPREFAPVVAATLIRIEKAADVVTGSDLHTTPFSNTPDREREAVIQQTFWIYTAVVTGKPYEKEHFADRVYDQFQTTTGRSVATLPDAQKEEVDAGIDDFWNTFQATGVEAKIISADPAVQAQVFPHIEKDKVKERIEGQGATENPQEAPPEEPPAPEPEPEEEEAACTCDSLKFRVSTDFGGIPVNGSDQKVTKFTASKSSQHKVVIEIDAENFYQKNSVSVSGITVHCACAGEPCLYYSGNVNNADPATQGKVAITDVKVTGADVSDDGETISDNGISVDVTADKKSKNYFIQFKVSATCMTEDCGKDTCTRYVSIEVKPKKK